VLPLLHLIKLLLDTDSTRALLMPPATRSLASARQCSIHLHSLRSTGIESGIHAKGIERCWRDNERSIERRK
jgi:hypothetical protein